MKDNRTRKPRRQKNPSASCHPHNPAFTNEFFTAYLTVKNTVIWHNQSKVFTHRHLIGEKKENILKLYTTYICFLCIHCLSEFIFFTVYCCLLFSMALNYKCSQGEAGTNDCSCRDVDTKWQRNKLNIPLA